MAFPYLTMMLMLGGIAFGIHAIYQYKNQNPPVTYDVRVRSRAEPEQINRRANRRRRPYERRCSPQYDKTCTICLDTVTADTERQLLPCNHVFHSGCIQAYFNINQSVHTCPNCRAQIGNQNSM